MEFFRGLVIGTLNFVAFLAFIIFIIFAAYMGYQIGVENAAEAVSEAGAEASFLTDIPAWAWAIIYGIVGYIVASLATGILFILLDIQDGVRDLIRVTKGEPAPQKKP